LWKYLLAWIPMVVIAIANGAMREALFTKSLGALRAHQLSCATGIFVGRAPSRLQYLRGASLGARPPLGDHRAIYLLSSETIMHYVIR